jgi:WD40 repeat protein
VFPDISKNDSNGVSACVFAPHGKTIVSASWDMSLKIWDVELGTCLTTLKGHRYLFWSVPLRKAKPL